MAMFMYVRFNIGKIAPLLLKNSMLARDIPFLGIDMISKPLIGVAVQQIRHSMVLGAVAQDRTSASWHNGKMLLIAPLSVNDFRVCTTNAPVPSPPNPSPTPPSIPSKKQIEKAFFRVVAFFWDNGGSFAAYLSEFFKTVVIEAPTVQLYWKRFNEKMDEAKKNDI